LDHIENPRRYFVLAMQFSSSRPSSGAQRLGSFMLKLRCLRG
jgi:hypothetical protein